MTKPYTLPLSDLQADLAIVGGKGASLARMARADLPVPDGFHVTTAAYRAFVAANALQPRILEALQVVDVTKPATLEAASEKIAQCFAEGRIPADLAAAVETAYAALATGDEPVAVRSSATAEDLPDASFAGQQETFLNVRGAEAVLGAVKRCWASLWTARAIGYRARQDIATEGLALAVVVQILVPAKAAGIMFTANPLNGRREQAVISAAWGLGEAVVGGEVTPDSFTVDKATNAVLAREIADKQTMTVRTATGVIAQAVPEEKRRAAALSDVQVVELAAIGAQIEQHYGMPMDIEWALAPDPALAEDGEVQLFILQARPITALPEAVAEIPAEWIVPDPKASYARGSLAEHTPNPVSPLFATLGLRIANRETDRLWRDMVDLDPQSVDMFVGDGMYMALNSYVYGAFRMRAKQIGPLLKVTFSQIGPMMRGSVARWQAARRELADVVASWEKQRLASLSPAELLDGARTVFGAAVKYYTVIQSTLPAASMSEISFSGFYNRLIKRKSDPEFTTLLFGFETVAVRAEKSLFDIAMWLQENPLLADYVREAQSETLADDFISGAAPQGLAGDLWTAWRGRLREHFDAFGRTAYEFDFAAPTPAETPTPQFDAIKLFLDGQSTSPYARHQSAVEKREQATRDIVARLGWPRKGWFEKLLKWAQDAGAIREDSIADMGLGHPLIRRVFAELGSRFVEGGAIESADDIYWLEETEVETLVAALEADESLAVFADHVPARKAEWRAALQLTPPVVLPEKSWMMKFFGGEVKEKDGLVQLKGKGTSAGRITAPACVLYGPQDFAKMQLGDVLVATTTTPAWTPLFTMASAVVTDIGGPLSHSSIVAREYGIPAVMAARDATRHITSGQMLTVDGGTGEVLLHPLAAAGTALAVTDWPLPDPKASYMRQSIIELLPDPLRPLFATLGLRAVNAGSLALFGEIVGTSTMPDEIVVTINNYAYYTFPMTLDFWGPALLNVWPFLPKFFQGETRWRDEARPRYLEVIERWQQLPLKEITAAELLEGAYQITAEAVNIYNVYQSGVVGQAMGAEYLFTPFYNIFIRRKGDPAALTLMLGGDSMPIQAEKSLFDVAQWCREERPGLAEAIAQTPSAQLAEALAGDQPPAEFDAALGDGWREFKARFGAHLERYGHAIYDLDFSNAVPADDPGPLLETLKVYLSGQGADPHMRQREQVAQREAAAQTIIKRLKGWRLKQFKKLLGWAQYYVPLREDTIADIGLGYPLLRRMLRELGERLVQAGMLVQPEEVYWLNEDEVQAAAAALDAGAGSSAALTPLPEKILQRQSAWRAAKRAVPPVGLPERSGMTGLMEKLGPARVQKGVSNTIKGVGASPGMVTAQACVLHGPEDFAKMQPGAVLVAGITTPAWTPLFALASAIVTDIGGPLSHSSIVAREYGIPAVLGTGVATKRIHHGQLIRVDGGAGTVTLLDEQGRELPEEAPLRKPMSRAKKVALVALVSGIVLGVFFWWRKRRKRRRASQ